MKPVLIDASSAILLHKADLLVHMTSAFALYMAPAVIREVTVPDRSGSAWFLYALTNGALRRCPPIGLPVCDDRLGGLGAGERETLIAHGEGKTRFVIMDDRKGNRLCRQWAIPYINALLCPKVLFWSGWIDRTMYQRSFDFLLTAGRYSQFVTNFARQCEPRDLSFFIPAGMI